MIFGIDVNQRICRRHERMIEVVDILASIKCFKEKEEEAEIVEKLETAYSLIYEVFEKKKQDLHDEIKIFQKEFAKDVLEFPELYQ